MGSTTRTQYNRQDGTVQPHLLWQIVICVLVLITISIRPIYAENYSSIKNKNILILHSYSLDYVWTQNLHKGIIDVLCGLDWTNTTRIEFLDTKNENNSEYIPNLVRFLATKHKDQQFDIIIATDNNALDFLNKYSLEITKQTPIVVTGVNGTNISLHGKESTTVIAEKANHLQTLQTALKLQPHAKNGYILSDASTTGKALKKEVQATLQELDSTIDFHFINEASLEQIIHFAATRNPEDFIYLLPYFQDGAGTIYAQGQVATTLTKIASVPVFCSWKFQLASGTVGGAVVSGERLGKLAAQTALTILQGQTVLPLLEDTGQSLDYVFNFPVLEQFKLSTVQLPSQAILLGKPISFFEQHKKVILPGSGLISCLLITLFLSLKNLTKQKIINNNSQHIISLNTEVIETQRELVSTLGEVIESRSKETGRHVKRVALYSRLIGEKVGLGPREIEILEGASPLHDIGKIGIPESILHHPGKLNEDDFKKIQEHTNIGRDILKQSNRALLKSACSIAHQHHERWDGTGYPQGLRGENIDIFARITMLADVYDALTMDRCYKPAWPEEKVLDYIAKEKGCYFDPKLVDIFFKNYDAIKDIRLHHPPESAYQDSCICSDK